MKHNQFWSYAAVVLAMVIFLLALCWPVYDANH